jgi:hypothetical protein
VVDAATVGAVGVARITRMLYVPVVALGEPTIRAGAEAEVAVKVRVCAPPPSMILKLSNVATPVVVDLTRVPETAPDPVARVTVIE